MHGRGWLLGLAAGLTAILIAGYGASGATLQHHARNRHRHAHGGTTGLNGLRIRRNRFVDDNGRHVTLHGVFYVSFEWACSHGHGISSQPTDPAAAQELLNWHVNFVRIGVSEDCWLGINGQPHGTSVKAYRHALKAWLDLLHSDGIYTEVGLMYAAPGTNPSLTQPAMPDEDHSPAFWKSLATHFKSEPDTIFGLFGEPEPKKAGGSWTCWLNGGSSCKVSYKRRRYAAAGMQQLVNVIRATGAEQPISVSGTHAGGDIALWLQYKPHDPAHQLAAEWHEYGNSACFSSQDLDTRNNATCWNDAPAAVAAQVPLINGEVGEHRGGNACAWSFMPTYLTWADEHHVSYAAWKYGVDKGNCTNMALIKNEAGDPTPIYGQGYRAWLAAH
jgi:hypothetical protein